MPCVVTFTDVRIDGEKICYNLLPIKIFGDLERSRCKMLHPRSRHSFQWSFSLSVLHVKKKSCYVPFFTSARLEMFQKGTKQKMFCFGT